MPFDTGQFLDVFAAYNRWAFPMQIVLVGTGLLAVWLAQHRASRPSKTVSAILSLFWLWMAIVYHWGFFSQINGMALIFGGFFMVQSLIFLYDGVIRSNLTFGERADPGYYVGIVLIAYALVIYPILGSMLGHRYPYAPTFGLPCPTTIFTFGILLRSGRTVPIRILIIPAIWSIIGASAVLALGMWEDAGLLIAAIAAVTFMLARVDRPDSSSARAKLI